MEAGQKWFVTAEALEMRFLGSQAQFLYQAMKLVACGSGRSQ